VQFISNVIHPNDILKKINMKFIENIVN